VGECVCTPSLTHSLLLHLSQVIAVGPGKADDDGKATPPSLTVGSTVLYSKYAGTELKNPRVEEEYVVISAADVLATVA
jgi:chaperonin GroES